MEHGDKWEAIQFWYSKSMRSVVLELVHSCYVFPPIGEASFSFYYDRKLMWKSDIYVPQNVDFLLQWMSLYIINNYKILLQAENKIWNFNFLIWQLETRHFLKILFI